MYEVVVTFCIVCVSLKKQATTEFKRVYFMSVGLLNILDVLTLTIMQYFSTIISDFHFKFVNFRFTFEQIPFDIQKWSVFTGF